MVRHLFCSEQLSLDLQLEAYSVFVTRFKILLLCNEMMNEMLPIQLQLTFIVFLLKISLKLLPLGKCFLMGFKNFLPTFFLTQRKYGGLNHMILRLCHFFLFVLVLMVFGVNVMLSWKPIFLSASLANTYSIHKISKTGCV